MFDLGIRAGHLLTMKDGKGEVFRDYFVGVKNGAITDVSHFKDGREKECARFLDVRDQIVMPGLINAHTHLAMSLFRGFEDDRSFHQWLFERIFPVEAALVNENFVRVGTELSMLECIRFGTTTVNDMYFYTETSAKVIDDVGLRAIIAWPFMDFPVPDEKHLGDLAIASRSDRFVSFYQKYKSHSRIHPALGPHAPYTCNDETMLQVLQLSKKYNVPIHMHVCETLGELEDSLRKYQKTPVKRLHDLGMLSPQFRGAHCVHLSDEEIQIYKKSGASMIYNPDSNLKLSSGIAPIAKYRKLGIPVAIGTDGAASNNDLSMFGVMDLGTKVQKSFNQDCTAMVAEDALNLATYEGAKAIGLGDSVGSIEVGKRADLITLRTDLPHVQPLYSVLSQLVYAYQGLEVDTVICDGRVLLEKGSEYNTIDPRSVYEKVEQIRTTVSQWLANLK